MRDSISGIYVIRNLRNGKEYVGQSCRVEMRLDHHRRVLRRGIHHNRHLQAAWRKNGEVAFEFKTILVCDPEMLTYFEQAAVDMRKPEYNILRQCVTSTLGVKPSAETRKRMSKALLGIKRTAETRARMSWANRGRICTAESRARMSTALRGRTYGPETLARMSVGQRGRRHSPETRARMSTAMRGLKRSPEGCANIASGQRKRVPFSIETRARMSEAHKGRRHPCFPETRAKISATKKLRSASRAK